MCEYKRGFAVLSLVETEKEGNAKKSLNGGDRRC
ncbi:hypothetical protein I656_03333 [Geobacillus sp. WSUCF1]|nr:hypothetical protein I656_03333 [Geobacillus sp. WSUCF1]